MYYKIRNSHSTKILFHALPLQSENQRYNLIPPIQIILPLWNQFPNTGAKTITTLANPHKRVLHSLSLKLLLLELSLKSSLSLNAIEQAYIYIYIDKCHMTTNRLENAGLNSNPVKNALLQCARIRTSVLLYTRTFGNKVQTWLCIKRK